MMMAESQPRFVIAVLVQNIFSVKFQHCVSGGSKAKSGLSTTHRAE